MEESNTFEGDATNNFHGGPLFRRVHVGVNLGVHGGPGGPPGLYYNTRIS